MKDFMFNCYQTEPEHYSSEDLSANIIPSNMDCGNSFSDQEFHQDISQEMTDMDCSIVILKDTELTNYNQLNHTSPADLHYDQHFRTNDPMDTIDDTVSELDTMSEYNSPYTCKQSRIPRIQRSNSLMAFKRKCSLQSLPHHSSRRSSISSRRSSTLSIDERPPWNYGAGGTPYQKLYPFGKRKISVDNYYD